MVLIIKVGGKMNTKRKERIRVQFFIVSFLIMMYLAFSFVIHPIGMMSFFSTPSYELFTNWEMKNSEQVEEIVNLCGHFEESKEKVDCVVNYVKRMDFDYDYNRINNSIKNFNVRQSDKLKENGYVCRDIALMYNAIFKRMGFHTDFIYEADGDLFHMYNNVWDYDSMLSCQINMEEYYCW
jgi:hypothetical protein